MGCGPAAPCAPLALRETAAARNRLSFRQQLEAQRARDRLSFYQTDIDDIPQPVHGTAARADQRVAGLVIVEIFRSHRADRHEAVGAGVVEFDEQTRAGDAGDAALEGCADAVGEVMRDQPVGSLALRLHRAPLGQRNLRGDLAQISAVSPSGSAPSPSPSARISARCTTRSA